MNDAGAVDAAHEVAQAFTGLLEPARGAVAEVAGLIARRIVDPAGEGLEAPFKEVVAEEIRSHLLSAGVLDGLGFFAHVRPGVKRRMVWSWVGADGRPDVTESAMTTALAQSAAYAYERTPWYKASIAEGSATFGPYLDYLGFDRQVVTLAMRVSDAKRPIGVVAGDLPLEAIEHVADSLRPATPRGWALIDDSGLFLVTTIRGTRPMSRCTEEMSRAAVTVPVPHSPWSVIVPHA